jgi:hypothetical protein
MGGQQGITGDLGAHLAVTQDEMREDREHRCTRRALDTPNSEPTQADTHVMGVTRQAPASITAGLVFELQAQSEETGEDTFEKRFAVTQQLHIGRFVVKINRDGPVFTGLAGSASHGSPSGQMVGVADDPRWGYDCTIARESRRVSGRYHEIRWNVRFSRESGGV